MRSQLSINAVRLSLNLAVIQEFGRYVLQKGVKKNLNNVGQVERQITLEGGELRVHRRTAPYGNPEVPEQFLVVRT